MDGFAVFYIVLTIVFTIYAVPSMWYYYVHYTRKSLNLPKVAAVTLRQVVSATMDKFSELNKRSSLLAFLSGVGNILICIDGWLNVSAGVVGDWKYPCAFSLHLRNMSWFWALYGFMARGLRLWMQIQVGKIARSGVYSKSANSGTKSATSSISTNLDQIIDKTLKDERMIRFGNYVNNEKSMALWVFFGGIFCEVLNTLLGFKFGWNGLNSDVGCIVGIHYMVIYAFLAVYLFILSPVMYFMLRNGKDAYNLRDTVVTSIFAATPVFIAFLIIGFGLPDSYYKRAIAPVCFAYFIIAYMHYLCFTAPVLRKETNVAVNKTYQSFVESLSDSELYEIMKVAAGEEFSTENPLFWDSYFTLMKKSYSSLVAYCDKNKKEINGNIPGLTKNHSFQKLVGLASLKAELNKAEPVYLLQSLATNITIQENVDRNSKDAICVPMASNLGQAYISLFQYFVSAGSTYELNIQAFERKEIEEVILNLNDRIDKVVPVNYTVKRLREDSISSLPSVASTSRKHLTSEIGTPVAKKAPLELSGVYLVFHDGKHMEMAQDDDNIYISIHIFDNIKDCVLKNMYENTFPRFLKKIEKLKQEDKANKV